MRPGQVTLAASKTWHHGLSCLALSLLLSLALYLLPSLAMFMLPLQSVCRWCLLPLGLRFHLPLHLHGLLSLELSLHGLHLRLCLPPPLCHPHSKRHHLAMPRARPLCLARRHRRHPALALLLCLPTPLCLPPPLALALALPLLLLLQANGSTVPGNRVGIRAGMRDGPANRVGIRAGMRDGPGAGTGIRNGLPLDLSNLPLLCPCPWT